MEFKLTEVQEKATNLLASAAKHILLRGGSRSGKTFAIVRAIIIRALIAPGSRHIIVGFRFNRVKTAIGLDTFPKVMKLCFPNVVVTHDKQEWYYKFANGSEIWLAGLDDKERTEKVLGKEAVTLFLNECSQISNDSREIALTRLAQKAFIKIDGEEEREMRLKAFYDENPPKKSHWSYLLFIKKIDPRERRPLQNPNDYVEMKLNPEDNKENIGSGYIDDLKNLSAAKRRRFLLGEFAEDDPNQLFREETIEKNRVLDLDELPDMVRIVVGVDPSGADDDDNEHNDAIGIIVGGLGTDGKGYIIEDLTVKAGPAVWGKVAVNGYEFHDGDCIYGEENFGGAMVKHVIRTANPRIPYKNVHATRGKVVRAEPVSALYEQGKIRHVGYLREAEDELVEFTTHGYKGTKSPNRADAIVWVAYALFPHLVKEQDRNKGPDVEHDEPSDPGAGY